ncbi:MAG: carboxypeptidase-like regulatory domain-containing protein, partial [Bacteroidetes bacterium]|nr:carboxypeptidase-like regulatory domain-containing protein [Bacteroidota bacterium]
MQYSDHRVLLSIGTLDSHCQILTEAGRAICRIALLVSVCMTLFATPAFQLHAQDVQMRGRVSDTESGEALIFAHILVVENGNGVVTNREGEYRLYLFPGEWTLRVSYIGYQSETRHVRVTDSSQIVNISLRPLTFEMPEVTVTPDDSLARLIVRRARQRRIEREKELYSYHMRAHNKAYSRIDSTKNMSEQLAEYLTASLLNVTETQTEAWFQRPGRHKILVHGRRQTDLFSEMGGAIHSGFARLDFSMEEITFGNAPGSIIGPISEEGLDGVYWYSVAGVSRGERHDIYRIRVLPKSSLRSTVSGYYYIEDSTWSITQVELEFSRAARAVTLPTAERISYRQQFSLYDRRHWLPSAGTILVEGKLTLMGSQVWIALEASSVIAGYRINPADIDSVFDGYRVEIPVTVDSISDAEWERGRLHPPSLVDARIHHIADSMATLRAAKEMAYDFGHVVSGKELQRDSQLWSIPGIINMLRFNRVEGLSIALPYAYENKDGPVGKYGAEIA